MAKRTNKARHHIVLETGRAIGDTVMATAVMQELRYRGYNAGIITSGFTYSLLDNIKIKRYAKIHDKVEPAIPEESLIVRLDHAYLKHIPHQQPLPAWFTGKSDALGHLSEVMAYDIALATDGKVTIHPKRDEVRVVLTHDEVQGAYEEKCMLMSQHGGKPITHLVIETTSINKNLPKQTVEQLIEELGDETTLCIANPINSITYKQKEEYTEKGVVFLAEKNLREAIARIHVADAVVAADTGLMHGAIASRQGTSSEISQEVLGYKPSNKEVIAVLGSSHPDVVCGYRDMQTVTTLHPCKSCGAHAYKLIGALKEQTGVDYYKFRDGSGCVFEEATRKNSSPCMEHVRPGDIAEAVRFALRSR
jgi:hypothetical protein